MNKRIEVQGNGLQAPYGIGEIIESYAMSPAGLKKAKKLAREWHNPPKIFIPGKNGEGEEIEIEVER